jgi:aminoglycoside phosphotransferase (APT) family kinase protein
MTAGWLDDVQGPPDAAALDAVAASILPGSRVSGVRRLGGGLGAAMHRFDLVGPDGERRRLVLRRYPRRALEEEPEVAARSWRTLEALARLGVSAPRPVWADVQGELFGTAAYVITHLPGSSDLCPRDLNGWLAGLAAGLAGLHRTPIDGVDLTFLGSPGESLDRALRWRIGERLLADAQSALVQETLLVWWPRLRTTTPVLCHGDYWAGNTLWQRGRLTAIVDWDSALVADPGLDIGYCRCDLAMQHGQEAAEVFLRAYEAAAGRRVPQLHIWDLLGAAAALPDPERWLPGLHELGRDDLTPAIVRERLAVFVGDALARSGSQPGTTEQALCR